MQLGRAFRATNGSRVLFDQLVGLSEQRGRHGEARAHSRSRGCSIAEPAESFDPPHCFDCLER
jgi:hypothetical protein